MGFMKRRGLGIFSKPKPQPAQTTPEPTQKNNTPEGDEPTSKKKKVLVAANAGRSPKGSLSGGEASTTRKTLLGL